MWGYNVNSTLASIRDRTHQQLVSLGGSTEISYFLSLTCCQNQSTKAKWAISTVRDQCASHQSPVQPGLKGDNTDSFSLINSFSQCHLWRCPNTFLCLQYVMKRTPVRASADTPLSRTLAWLSWLCSVSRQVITGMASWRWETSGHGSSLKSPRVVCIIEPCRRTILVAHGKPTWFSLHSFMTIEECVTGWCGQQKQIYLQTLQ